MVKSTIYPNLTKTINEHKDTYVELAKALNTTRTSMYRKMTGIYEWKVSEIKTICKRYNKKFEDLF